jgi:hypothetical protein
MKKGILFLLSCLFFLSASAQSKPAQTAEYHILLSGASFASPENGWFEMGCTALNARPVNRATGGESIANTANKMNLGVMYTGEELETLDAFVIMQVHDRDVVNESGLLENFRDYRIPSTRGDYAAAFDYVIKRYISDCYELRNDPNSKYYGSKAGKPALIVLCTDWHDARTTYNASVRKLAGKWGLPLVEFDRNIGFSKNSLHPVTRDQYSLLYSPDTQVIDSVIYGWHTDVPYEKNGHLSSSTA